MVQRKKSSLWMELDVVKSEDGPSDTVSVHGDQSVVQSSVFKVETNPLPNSRVPGNYTSDHRRKCIGPNPVREVVAHF